MRITVNGASEELPDSATVSDLLRCLNLAGSPCAVEVNKKLVPRRDHEGARLAPGDQVEVVTLVGGG